MHLKFWGHHLGVHTSGLVAQYLNLSRRNAGPQKHGCSRWIASISCMGVEKHALKVYRPPSWIVPLPVSSHSFLASLIGKLDPENIGMAAGISLISCLEAEIQAFEVWRPPSWFFPLSVRSHSIHISPSGMLNLDNVGLAVGISVIFCWLPCLKAESPAIEMFRPPSWIFILPVELHSIPIYYIGKLDPKSG